jgi:tetraacyldisaccharide 4'-kinase
MDDGYQNFTLAKDLSLIVVDAENGFGNGRILPAGPLRESIRGGLARADAVVLVGDGTPPLPGYSGPVMRARLVPQAALKGGKTIAFAGIGRPEKFFATLRGTGADLAGTFAFADHHMFTAGEIARLKEEARSKNAMLVTTEKDFVRLAPAEREGIHAFPVQAVFEKPDALQSLLDKLTSPAGAAR